MSSKKTETALNVYQQLIDATENVALKGKTMPYTSSNGHMFSQLNKDGDIGIRLPKDEQQAFLETYNAELFKSYGAIMKGYVCIPETLYDDIKLLSTYFKKGLDYVNSLEPK